MKHKVSQLEGLLLDAAVILADGGSFDETRPQHEFQMRLGEGVPRNCVSSFDGLVLAGQPRNGHPKWANWWYSPSTDWSIGGPIMERYEMLTQRVFDLWYACPSAGIRSGHFVQFGGPLLVAVMRAIVAGKFGDEIDLPDAG